MYDTAAPRGNSPVSDRSAIATRGTRAPMSETISSLIVPSVAASSSAVSCASIRAEPQRPG